MLKIKKPKYLYHGSSHKLEILRPEASKDKIKGVYATHIKKIAIVMGLISGKGIKASSFHKKNKKLQGIYDGDLRSRVFYVYFLSPETFKKINSWEWISKKDVKSIKAERLLFKDYKNWIRKATKREKERWSKKF